MIEFSGDGKVHGDELLDAAVAASTGSRFLQRTLYGFDAAVVLPGLEAAKDAGQVGGDRSGKTLEGFEWVVPNPAETAWEKRLGFVRRSGRGTDGTQGLLDALGASHLEIRSLQPVPSWPFHHIRQRSLSLSFAWAGGRRNPPAATAQRGGARGGARGGRRGCPAVPDQLPSATPRARTLTGPF